MRIGEARRGEERRQGVPGDNLGRLDYDSAGLSRLRSHRLQMQNGVTNSAEVLHNP